MYEVYGGLLKEDIVCTINGKKVCCPPESTILEAARGAGIDIPTLCYLKGLTPTGACGICAVEIEEDGERICVNYHTVFCTNTAGSSDNTFSIFIDFNCTDSTSTCWCQTF